MANPLRYKTTLCTAWEAGEECKFGSRCMYAHGTTELRTIKQNANEGVTTAAALRRMTRQVKAAVDRPEEGTGSTAAAVASPVNEAKAPGSAPLPRAAHRDDRPSPRSAVQVGLYPVPLPPTHLMHPSCGAAVLHGNVPQTYRGGCLGESMCACPYRVGFMPFAAPYEPPQQQRHEAHRNPVHHMAPRGAIGVLEIPFTVHRDDSDASDYYSAAAASSNASFKTYPPSESSCDSNDGGCARQDHWEDHSPLFKAYAAGEDTLELR